MPERLKPSDPKYPLMDSLAQMLAVLSNPLIHLLGYGEGLSQRDAELNKFDKDVDLMIVVEAVKKAQQNIIDSQDRG